MKIIASSSGTSLRIRYLTILPVIPTLFMDSFGSLINSWPRTAAMVLCDCGTLLNPHPLAQLQQQQHLNQFLSRYQHHGSPSTSASANATASSASPHLIKCATCKYVSYSPLHFSFHIFLTFIVETNETIN